MTVPGSPASVLAAVLRADAAHPYDASNPRQRRLATFSSYPSFPYLPSLTTDEVFLPQNAVLDANLSVTGTFTSQGWGTAGIATVTASYTPSPANAVILASAAIAPLTITLPDATQPGFVAGQRYTIKKTDATANAVTIAASAGQKIDGATTQTLTTGNTETSVVFDGANWWVWSGITTATVTPGGTASGDLSGTYPSPTVVATHLTAALPVNQGGTGLAAAGSAGQTLTTALGGGLAWANAPVDWKNVVTGYGADPTGVADSTLAIQNAITAAGTGGVVYLPAGTYKLSSALATGSGVTLCGDGPAATILHQTSASANAITISGTTVLNAAIRDMRINGPNSGTGIGIAASANSGASPVVQLVLRNLIIYQMGGNGVDLLVPIVSVLDNIQSVNNLGTGFSLHGGGTSTVLTACYANFCSGRGFWLNSMSYTSLVGCAADGNPLGYEITSCDSVSLVSCGAESTAAAGGLDGTSFKLNGAQNSALHNCRAFRNAAVGAWITGSSAECAVIGFTETATGSPTASLKVDTGSGAMVANYATATGQSFAAGTTTILNSFGYTFLRSPEFGNAATCDSGLSSFGNVDVASVGNGLRVAEGTNAKQGTATLAAGTVVVANTSVTANSRIFLCCQAPGGTPGFLRVSARTAGTSFTILSSSGTDTSVVAYQIFEPG